MNDHTHPGVDAVPTDQPTPVSHSGHDAGHEMSGHSTAPSGHGGHTDHSGHAGHGGSGHAGHGDHVGMFRRLFWIMLVLAVPVIFASGMFRDARRILATRRVVDRLDLPGAGHGDVRLGRFAVPDRRCQ